MNVIYALFTSAAAVLASCLFYRLFLGDTKKGFTAKAGLIVCFLLYVYVTAFAALNVIWAASLVMFILSVFCLFEVKFFAGFFFSVSFGTIYLLTVFAAEYAVGQTFGGLTAGLVLCAVFLVMQGRAAGLWWRYEYDMPKYFLIYPVCGVVFALYPFYALRAVSTLSIAFGFVQLYTLKRYLIAEDNLRTVSRSIKNQDEHYKKMGLFEDEFKFAWHDYKNHMIAIQYLIKKEDDASLKEYIVKIGALSGEPFSHFTGNLVVDSILSEKMWRASQDNILVTTSIKLPETLNVDEADLCVMLGNTMDNAIEGCLNVDKDERKIELNIGFRHDYIHIFIKNPTVDDGPQKPSGVFQGIGLESVKRILERYGGQLVCERISGEFKCEMILKNIKHR